MKHTLDTTHTQRFAGWRAVVFLGLLITAFGCREDRLIGLEVQPDGYLDELQFVDTFSIQAYTFQGKPQRSKNLQNFIGRSYNDVFGTTEASLYLNFSLESENVFLELAPSDYVVDSLVFTMWPISVYGEPSDSMTIEVLAVDERMYVDSTYTSDRTFRLDDDVLDRRSIYFEDAAAVTGALTDSNYNGMRFNLGNDLGEFLLQGIGTSYSSSSQLRDYFNGLHFRISDESVIDKGAIYNFAVSGVGTGLTLYYHYTDPEDTTKVETQLNFEVTTSCVRFNHFERDRTGSLVESALNDPTDDDSLLFIEGMSGVQSRVLVPYLNNFADQTNAAVSRAELVFKSADEQPNDLGRSAKLYLLDYEYDPTTGDTIESLTLDFAYSDLRHGGTYNDDDGTYRFDITRQVQKVIEAKRLGKNVNFGYSLNAQVPLINGNVRNQNVLDGSSTIVLKLYYTDISD